MDFVRVAYKEVKDKDTGVTIREFYPALQALESQDLVIRGGQFVAIWDEDKNLYSRRLSHVPDIIDRAFWNMAQRDVRPGDKIKKVREFDNQIYSRLQALIRSIGDMGPELDQTIVFADEQPTKDIAATFKMSYSLSDAPCPAWDQIVSTLYDPEQRAKIEWAIGSILTGASINDVQKFYVFFGPPGSGKSTIMNIIEMIFAGHTAAFSAYEMGRADAGFPLEPFKNNPLVGIDQDGDLSRIELNKNINAIVSHDKLLINSKSKSLFEIIPRSTLFVGSNDPVRITNRKSGLFRRVVDIQPTGNTIPEEEYHRLMAQVAFEIGAIAHHCIQVFELHGATYMSSYRATDMMYRTNDIFNFVEDNRLILAKGIALQQAHKMYVEWCNETETRNNYKRFQFRDLLMDYFKEFHPEIMIEGHRHRSYFKELRDVEKFSWKGLAPKPTRGWLELDSEVSLLDEVLKDMPAQLAQNDPLYPLKKPWEDVTETLSDIDTALEHYVKVPPQHIVIDFDIKDEHGNKSLALCVEAATKWPPTYAEVSRSGNGLHLHYDFDGDVDTLAAVDPGKQFEVKTLVGGASLRRRRSLGNTLDVSTISSGLPLKEEKVLGPKTMQSEKGLRAQIFKALKKDVHVGTKSNMDFIKMVTDEAHASGLVYDISDMWDDIFVFAMGSTNQKQTSIDIAMSLKLKSEEEPSADPDQNEKPLALFDLEVYPNLIAVGWMYADEGKDEVVTLINPTPAEIEEMTTNLRLMGWYNRPYDNHILWAIMLGWSTQAIYDLSRRLVVENDNRATFINAYNLAYGDLYDMASNDNKKSLKRWEVDLGLPHMEMDLPWDEPVPEDRVLDVIDYLKNDVRSTKAVLKEIDPDFRARQILAEISGLAVCNTNRQHTEKLIFGKAVKEGHPDLVYTDLKEMFPGYTFDQFAPGKDKSLYKGIKVSEGGWVDSEPGIWYDVAVLDIASMHPTSIVELNMFGDYTPNFQALLEVRLAIKRGDFESARNQFDGRLAPYLGDEKTAKMLSDALKIVINSVYGLTAASFPNTFKDPRNIDNIVAKRGALFMVDLKEFVEKAGFKVVHVKTDSVKIPGATPELIAQISEFGEQYGYTFEHEDTYEKFCLVNDAVYVAFSKKYQAWQATGAQFKHPVVFKTLFSKEEFKARDYVEVKQVSKGAMYLVSLAPEVRQFVGRFGAFVPVFGGRKLLRIDGEKEHSVAGTKDHLWEIDEIAIGENLDVDYTYFQGLVDVAKSTIEKYGSYTKLVENTRP